MLRPEPKQSIKTYSILLLFLTCFSVIAGDANVMPAGFENVFIGMTTQQLHTARSRVDFEARKNLGLAAIEVFNRAPFFDAVDYTITRSQTVEIVSFWPVVNNQSGETMK